MTFDTNQHSQQFIIKTSAGKLSAKQILYNEITDYINFYITENLSVTDIAEHFGYNPKYLSKQFKEINGTGIKRYIISQKIEYANFLLLDSNLSITEIAYHMGFQNYHQFERTYKEHALLSPSEYRSMFSKHINNYG